MPSAQRGRAGVRQGHGWGVGFDIAEHDQVKVEGAVAPNLFAHAPEVCLDGVQSLEECARLTGHAREHDRVEVAGCGGVDAVRFQREGFPAIKVKLGGTLAALLGD